MKDCDIKAKLKVKHREWLDCLPDELKAEAQVGSFFAGGCIASLVKNKLPKDYDIFMINGCLAEKLLDYYLACLDRYNTTPKPSKASLWDNGYVASGARGYLEPTFITPNAVTLAGDVQLILKIAGTPSEVITSFDFAHTQAFFFPHTDQLHISEQASESLLNEGLRYLGSDYPLSSLLRMKKFVTQGWTCPSRELIKIAYQVSKLDLQDPEILRSQLVGMSVSFLDFIRDVPPTAWQDFKTLCELLDYPERLMGVC